jgi:hypothetical protein
MKFLVDENIQSEQRAVNYVDVGIHDNMELTEVKVDTSPKGNNFLAFTFTDPEGRVLTKTEWQPTGPEDDVLMKKIQNQAKRIKHIMTKFMAVEHTKIEYDTEQWVKYASTVKAKLDAVKQGVKVRIKAVYDNSNYVTLPNYTPFIERMDTEKTSLSILSIDKLTKDEADTEVKVTNPFETSTTGTAPQVDPTIVQSLTAATPPANNDLPF